MKTFVRGAGVRAASIAIALALTAPLAACAGLSGFSADADTSDTLQWLTEPAGEPVWSSKADTFSSGPVIVEDRVVSLVSIGAGELVVRAWNAETGDTEWEYPASTGDVDTSRTWPLTIIEGEDGRPLVANLAPPTLVNVETGMQEIEGFGLSMTSRDLPMHQVQFIDVRTGEIVAETERHLMYVWNTCGFVTAVCARTLNLDKWRNGEPDPYDEKLIRSTGEIVPLFPDGYQSGFSTVAQVFVVDRTDGTTAMIRFDGTEVKWEIDLDEVGLAATPTDRLAFGGRRTTEEDRPLLVAQVADKGQQGPDVSEFSTAPVVLVVDWFTGELLWSEAPLSMSVAGLFDAGELTYRRGVGGNFEAQRPATTLLESRDLLTGAIAWELEVAELKSSYEEVTSALHVPVIEYGMVFSNDSYHMLDLTKGEFKELSDDQVFPCSSRGPAVQLPKWSNPNEPLVGYTSNIYSAGCLSDRTRITDPTELSKMAVAGSTTTWQPWSETPRGPEELFEEQFRVFSNETGVHAYRF